MHCYVRVFHVITFLCCCIDSKLLDESNLQQELRNYEIVAPHIQTQGLWRRDVSTRSSLVSESIFNLRLTYFTVLFAVLFMSKLSFCPH